MRPKLIQVPLLLLLLLPSASFTFSSRGFVPYYKALPVVDLLLQSIFVCPLPLLSLAHTHTRARTHIAHPHTCDASTLSLRFPLSFSLTVCHCRRSLRCAVSALSFVLSSQQLFCVQVLPAVAAIDSDLAALRTKAAIFKTKFELILFLNCFI